MSQEPTTADFFAAIDALNRLLSHKADSLFTYVLSATPYTPEGDESKLAELQKIAHSHEGQSREIARVIDELGEAPEPTGHDVGASDLNYLAVNHLVGKLIAYQEHVIEHTRADLPLLAGYDEAEHVALATIRNDERDLERLRRL